MNTTDSVSILPDPEWIRVIVAGGQGAIVGQFVGAPVELFRGTGQGATWITNRIELPAQ